MVLCAAACDYGKAHSVFIMLKRRYLTFVLTMSIDENWFEIKCYSQAMRPIILEIQKECYSDIWYLLIN